MRRHKSCQEGEICRDERCKKVDCDTDSDCYGWDGVEAVCADGRCRQGCDPYNYSYRICPEELECFSDPRRSGRSLSGYCRSGCSGEADCPDGFECSNGTCVIPCTPDQECFSCPDDECPNDSICNGSWMCAPSD